MAPPQPTLAAHDHSRQTTTGTEPAPTRGDGRKKTASRGGFNSVLAEGVGFEPTVGDYPTHAFQACDLNRSSTSPEAAHSIRKAVFVKFNSP